MLHKYYMPPRLRDKPIAPIIRSERIRGPALSIFKRASEVYSFPSVLNEVEQESRVLVSNDRMEEVLRSRSPEWPQLRDALRRIKNVGISSITQVPVDSPYILTGTFIGFEGDEGLGPCIKKRLGSEIVYTDATGVTYVFPTGDAKGTRSIIFAEHPEYALIPDGNLRFLIHASRIKIIERMEDMPGAKESPYGTRYRCDWNTYVGPLIRCIGYGKDHRSLRRWIYFGKTWNNNFNFSVLVEAPIRYININIPQTIY